VSSCSKHASLLPQYYSTSPEFAEVCLSDKVVEQSQAIVILMVPNRASGPVP
jgi:hypothetical protein